MRPAEKIYFELEEEHSSLMQSASGIALAAKYVGCSFDPVSFHHQICVGKQILGNQEERRFERACTEQHGSKIGRSRHVQKLESHALQFAGQRKNHRPPEGVRKSYGQASALDANVYHSKKVCLEMRLEKSCRLEVGFLSGHHQNDALRPR